MTTHRAPSQEQLKLLGELSAGSSPLREEAVLGKAPDWNLLEKNGLLPKGSAAGLSSLHPMTPVDRAAAIRNTPELAQYILPILGMKGDLTPLQYTLTLFYDVIRNDTSVLDSMVAALRGMDVFSNFYGIIKREKIDSSIGDKAGFILSSLIARAPSGYFSDDDAQKLMATAVQGDCSMTVYGRLDCLKNLMKLDRYRPLVWKTPGAVDFVIGHLDATKPGTVYAAVFCCWLLTFNREFLEPFTQAGGVEKICAVLRESKTEKVVRICIHTILNCLPSEMSVEALIQQNAVHTLTLLEYEKWRDEELYMEIRDGLAALQNKIKLFSNFDRYLRELDSGKLTWSFLHSEKFWHQNVIHFEENEFSAVKKLVLLLRSSDPQTLAVACFDLGEFARLYPTGKKIIQKLKAKELAMMLMSHKDRDVSREALLCVQKMMLDNWKTVAEGGAAHQ